jgi:sugar lactone lactonase YvrE
MQYKDVIKRHYWIITILVITGLVVFYSSCKKTDQGGSTFSITPDSGPAGNLVTITGSGFDPDITQDSVTFNGLPGQVVNVSPTQMQAYVPDGVTTGPVMVFVSGRGKKGPVYTVSAISISSISPAGGLAGDSISINGLGLSNSGSLSTLAGLPAVKFNGKTATVVSATPTKLVVLVPNKADAGPVTVAIGGETATGPVFNYLGIDTLHPGTGNVGTIITMTGGFGATPGQDTVTVNGVKAAIDSASPVKLVATVPTGAGTGNVVVRAGGRAIQGPVFTFVAAPKVSGISPVSGPVGIRVTVAGTGFSAVLTENVISFNGKPGTVVSASATQLIVTAPAGVTTGQVVATVNNQAAKGPVFTVQSLGISSISPVNFISPAVDTIRGVGFSTTASGNMIQFNGKAATVVSASDTELIVQVAPGSTSGKVTAQVGGITATGPAFSTVGVFTLAGSGQYVLANGQGTQASFLYPIGIAVDAAGNAFVADQYGNNIKEISPLGLVTSFAGDPNGGSGSTNGQGTAALFNSPSGIVIDKNGNLYVTDNGNVAIREITSNGTVTTFATIPSGNAPGALAIDASGNIYVTDNGNVSYGQAGGGNVYEFNSAGTLVNTFNIPNAIQLLGIAVDATGNVYTTDQGNSNIYKGAQTVVQGTGYYTKRMALDNGGNLLVTDYTTNQIFELSPSNNFTYTALTGTGYPRGLAAGFTNGPLATAQFNNPNGLTVDAYGVIYVADGQSVVRKISLK